MANKAISVLAVLFLVFLVTLEIPKVEASDECRKPYVGNYTDFALCAPRVYPSICHWHCISENGAKGGDCYNENFQCICDFCNESDKCWKKYVGDQTDSSLCAPRIYPPFCHTYCIKQNGAKGGDCYDGCYCNFCYSPFPSRTRPEVA